jgi:P-type conjugative transfer protein TrbJ
VAASDSAVGSLQAQQATNQLVALSTKQQLQIQNLMAAQYRAEALEEVRKAEAERAARTSTDRSLGPGHAYTPQ